MKTSSKTDIDTYWNHNTVYHKWLLSHVKGRKNVLDVGCGDGLLVYRLSKVCDQVIGIDTHRPSIEKAKQRLYNTKNTSVINVGFENFKGEPHTFDAIIFVASLHHMDLDFCIKKSVELLKPSGKLLIVGLAHPQSVFDWIIKIGRILPVKLGDLFHDVKGDVGAPITNAKERLGDIRKIAKEELPNAKIKQALYYRYLLTWVKPNK
ncbi:MAG: class I SAM-dependent methyltransferase [Bacillota bacterium]|nr:class I SAM-dependent methyltransferase [Bacillota bacterium]